MNAKLWQHHVNKVGDEWTPVGPPYRDKEVGKSWTSFKKAAWHGMPVRLLPVKEDMRPIRTVDSEASE